MKRDFISDDKVDGGRASILKTLQSVSSKNTWRANGIEAVDDRVFWSEGDNGVFLFYREEK